MEDNGGELAERVGTRCGQRGSLLREQRETLCPLEADHDQVGSVVPREFEGMSAVNGCTRSLGGMETPGAREVARIPSVVTSVIVPSVKVPGCVVSTCVYASMAKCVLRRTHSGSVRVCAKAPPSVEETPCVDETPCARATPSASETPCVSGVVMSEPENVLPSTPCVKGAPQPETARVCEARCVGETPRVSAPACVSGVVCVSEARRVSERPCVRRKAACVRSLCVREMSVGMHEHAAASPCGEIVYLPS